MIKFLARLKTILIFIILLVIINHISCFAQTEWTYYSETPVLAMDPLIAWGAYGQPNVIVHNDTIKMWFAVAETTPTDPVKRGRIHYAWSLDGYTFTKYDNNPVLDVGEELDWDGQWLDTPGVLWDGTEFKLYYYADSLYYDVLDHTAIGLATSPDGINWTRQGKVLEMGTNNEWDGHHIELPELYYDSETGLYAMLYSGMDRVNYPFAGFIRIGLAISWDGYSWTKWPDNPVMDVGTPPAFNDIGVGGPSIIETDGVFEMWYTGVQALAEPYDSWDSLKVGYAVSLNGTSWIQFHENPVLQADPGDSTVFWAIDVIWDENDDLYKMYFESEHWAYEEPGVPGEFHEINAIFLATAPRTLLNSDDCNVSVSENIIIQQGGNCQLLASGGDYYQWDPPDGLSQTDIPNPIAFPEQTTTYSVLIVSENCITREQVTVTVEEDVSIANVDIENPTIFPNPSGTTKKIYFTQNMSDCSVKIFNQLGQIAFVNKSFSGNAIELDTSLESGIYIIQIENDEKLSEIKMVID